MTSDPFKYADGFRVSAGPYVIHLYPGHLSTFEHLATEARLVDVNDLRESFGRACSVTVSERNKTLLVATFRFELHGGLGPALALVPDVHTLFVGAGEEIFCYDLATPKRLWRGKADTGLWPWEVVDETVLMSAELEFAAWDRTGFKLWGTFVEPPWSFDIDAGKIRLDVMGMVSEFPLRQGPASIRLAGP
jgi:hypothetical protein